MFPIQPVLKRSLDAARHNGGMTFTAAAALVSSSFAMSVTGGGLTAYEARAIQATVASAFGNEAAAAELERATPYSTAPAVHLIPMQPINFVAAEQPAPRNGDLLGGPALGPALDRARVLTVADTLPVAPICTDALCDTEMLPEPAEIELAAISVAAF